ncbi:MAG: hypothetical protein Q9204_002146 [Flavoplaca sp. TL-2023a]
MERRTTIVGALRLAVFDGSPEDGREGLRQGYSPAKKRPPRDLSLTVLQKFSKSNLLFLQPSLVTGPVVVIPPSHLRQILSKPESEIDAYGPQLETLQGQYTIGDKDVYSNNFHTGVVPNQLTKNLGSLTEAIADELAFGFERSWGTSRDWTTVKAWDSILEIIAGAANRVFVGAPLCKASATLPLHFSYQSLGRNEKYLEHSRKYAMFIFGGAMVINILPSMLRPVVGTLLRLLAQRHLAVCQELCRPVVKERLRKTRRKMLEPEFHWDPPV